MGRRKGAAVRERFHDFLNVDVSGIQGEEEGMVLEAVSNQDLREVFDAHKTEIFRSMTEKLKGEWASHPFVYLFAANRHQGERLQEILRNYDVALPILSSMSTETKAKEWGIVIGPLRRGFRTKQVIVLTEEDIVGPKKADRETEMGRGRRVPQLLQGPHGRRLCSSPGKRHRRIQRH